jgi:YidC/Oxa1 family membrane protein insertase
LNEALFTIDREALGDDEPGERIVFRWADGQGLEARKSLTFRPRNYLVGIEAEVLDRGRPVSVGLVLGPGFAALESAKGRSTYYYEGQAVWSHAGGETRMSRGDVADQPSSFSGRLRWVGLEDQYFAALIVPGTAPTRVAWQSAELNRTDHDSNGTTAAAAKEPLLAVTIPEGGAGLFVGPKKYTLLRDYGLGLESVVWFSSYGFLAWVSKGIFLALLWIHDNTIQNYGMAIVLSTFALRVLLFPVNQYSMVTMKKAQLQMQRLQPKVNAIRAKNKKSKDAEGRAKMNQELMEMYRQEGVNPMGGLTGCLPLLAQFPILIGFYNMLTVAVELRGAPFVGWIQDLSREDPYWITPLLMGVTMFIQQKMAMNKVKDPQQLQQQRIMLIMPLIFMIFCVNMPSGLVLYWFVNNLLGIGQQWLVNRHTERLEIAAQKA